MLVTLVLITIQKMPMLKQGNWHKIYGFRSLNSMKVGLFAFRPIENPVRLKCKIKINIR